jgi:hypothetical protein
MAIVAQSFVALPRTKVLPSLLHQQVGGNDHCKRGLSDRLGIACCTLFEAKITRTALLGHSLLRQIVEGQVTDKQAECV